LHRQTFVGSRPSARTPGTTSHTCCCSPLPSLTHCNPNSAVATLIYPSVVTFVMPKIHPLSHGSFVNLIHLFLSTITYLFRPLSVHVRLRGPQRQSPPNAEGHARSFLTSCLSFLNIPSPSYEFLHILPVTPFPSYHVLPRYSLLLIPCSTHLASYSFLRTIPLIFFPFSFLQALSFISPPYSFFGIHFLHLSSFTLLSSCPQLRIPPFFMSLPS
jgi:hypothetical protein